MTEETFDNSWPKSTRLNRHNRRQFVDTVLADLMPDEAKPTTEGFAEKWGDNVYELVYGPHLETMQLLPSWMFRSADDFTVDLFKHESRNDPVVKAHSGVVRFKLSKERPLIRESSRYSWSTDAGAEMPPGDHEVVRAYKNMCQQTEDWQSKWYELRGTLEEVAEACNTSHQLFRAWPKAVKYAEECFPYVEPTEAKRGGQTSISAEQLDLTAKLAQVTVGVTLEN